MGIRLEGLAGITAKDETTGEEFTIKPTTYEAMHDILSQKIDEKVLKDIQFLLIKYLGYMDDIGTTDAWSNKEFVNMCIKYGFNKGNIYKGFEDMCC